MRSILYIIIAGIVLSGTGGCLANKAPVLGNVGSAALLSEYRDRALLQEDQGDVQGAIFSWQVVQSLRPEDTEAQNKIDSLHTRAQKKAAEHYAKANHFAEEGEWREVMHQAVVTLRYEPGHEKALALINRDRNIVRHHVQQGETLVSVAEYYFNDPDKAPIIAFFNDLPNAEAPVIPGMVLVFPNLPKLEVEKPKASTAETDALLARARGEFTKRKYAQVIDLTQKLVRENPYEQEAQFLLNKSLLALGKEHLKKKEYDKAEADLKQIAEGFPGRKEAWAELTSQKQKLAEEHYRKGVKFYLNEDLAKAIGEWQLTLKFYPAHTRALENIEKTQAILKKLKTVN